MIVDGARVVCKMTWATFNRLFSHWDFEELLCGVIVEIYHTQRLCGSEPLYFTRSRTYLPRSKHSTTILCIVTHRNAPARKLVSNSAIVARRSRSAFCSSSTSQISVCKTDTVENCRWERMLYSSVTHDAKGDICFGRRFQLDGGINSELGRFRFIVTTIQRGTTISV